jgi:hypothetical protein
VREVALDSALMHQVVIGVPQHDISTHNQERCEAAALHLRWDGQQLYIRGRDGTERVVVPWCDRRELVRELATQLGFPGGKRLYELAKVGYYWTSMQRDVVTWCTHSQPNQVEAAKFKPPPHLHPT